MSGPAQPRGALVAWRAIPGSIERAIEGLAEGELDLRGGADGMIEHAEGHRKGVAETRKAHGR